MNIQIQKGVPKPANVVTRDLQLKYPVDKMEPEDYFEVPKEMFFGDQPFREEGYDGKRHRERVNAAVRGWALKRNKEMKEEQVNAGTFKAEDFKPYKFTVALLTNGNIGVWRDQ